MKECNYVIKVLYINGFTVNVLNLASLHGCKYAEAVISVAEPEQNSLIVAI